MASIVKRRNKYAVVYNCIDENGIKHQRWETYDTSTEAKKRKTQVEYELDNKTFVVPSAKTVRDLLNEYVAIYGINKWALSTYDGKVGLIQNYINPLIGDVKLNDINTQGSNPTYLENINTCDVIKLYIISL